MPRACLFALAILASMTGRAAAQPLTQIDVGRFPDGSGVPSGSQLGSQWRTAGVLFAARRSTEPAGQQGSITPRSYGAGTPCGNYLFFSPDVRGAVAILHFVYPDTLEPAEATFFEIRADWQPGEFIDLVGLDAAGQVTAQQTFAAPCSCPERISLSGAFTTIEVRTLGNPGIGFTSCWSESDWGIKFRACISRCAPDLNCDGLIDFADYLAFLNAYNAEDPRVDFTQDGLIDFSDYLEFLNLYDAGC